MRALLSRNKGQMDFGPKSCPMEMTSGSVEGSRINCDQPSGGLSLAEITGGMR